MAARRTSTMPKGVKSTSTETKSSDGNVTNKANNSDNEKKSAKVSGTIVKSRYLQSAEKTVLSKSSSLNKETMKPPQRPASSKSRPKVGTPPRRSVVPQLLTTSIMSKENETSILTKNVLQSTFSGEHSICPQPDFDLSAITEKNPPENAAVPDKRVIEMETFLLAYLTAKMQHNTAKLRVEAESRMLEELEKEEALRMEVMDKKRLYEIKEKNRSLNELLELQMAALAPIVEAAPHFTEEYKSFAAAVDTTLHELPVKNFSMDIERTDFLDKAVACLKQSEQLGKECTHGNTQENSTSLDSLKSMKNISKNIGQELKGAFWELQELSSLICRETIHLQQAAEEEQLGAAQTHTLYSQKH